MAEGPEISFTKPADSGPATARMFWTARRGMTCCRGGPTMTRSPQARGRTRCAVARARINWRGNPAMT
ncbi:MAG: hypothetical protein O9248_00540 [Rhodobacteraceae bacterium]|nr:hypothetical protein [Paracoccaceae bacterium]